MQMSFQGVLEPDGTNLRWVVVRIPFDPVETWPNRVGMRVKGTIKSGKNGEPFAFRTSLFGVQESGYILLINKQMQKAARVMVGGLAQIVLEPDLEERSATAPPELARLLKADRSLKKWYEQLSYSIRKYIADAVCKLKSAEARTRRAEQFVEQMMLAMEGEHEVPPILQMAFRRQPQARAGWEAMTPIQRRSHLLGIFHYQGVEARAKRADKAVEEALRVAERVGKSSSVKDKERSKGKG